MTHLLFSKDPEVMELFNQGVGTASCGRGKVIIKVSLSFCTVVPFLYSVGTTTADTCADKDTKVHLQTHVSPTTKEPDLQSVLASASAQSVFFRERPVGESTLVCSLE